MQNPSVSQILDRINQDSQSSTTKKSTRTIKAKKTVKSAPIAINLNFPDQQKEENFDDQWKIILECTKQTFENVRASNYESAYLLIEKLSKNQAQTQNLAKEFTNTIKSYAIDVVKQIKALNNYQDLLNLFTKIQQTIEKLETLFAPFEKTYLYPVTIKQSVKDIFISQINGDSDFQSLVVKFLAEAFRDSRIKNTTDKIDEQVFQLIANCSQFFEVESALLDPLLDDAMNYYQNLKHPSDSPDKLIDWFETQINTEIAITKFFKPATSLEIVDTSRQTLYGLKFYTDMQPIIDFLVQSQTFNSIIKLSNLCDYNAEMQELFLDEFKFYAKSRVEKAKQSTNMNTVKALLKDLLCFRELKTQLNLDSMTETFKCFGTEMRAKYKRLEIMFAEFINAEIQNSEFSKNLSDFIFFFRQLSSIDDFIVENASYLVNRLLKEDYSFIENEELFTQAIEEIVGNDGVKKTYQMISDVKESREKAYNLSLPGKIIVIKYDSWPQYPSVFHFVPGDIANCRSEFQSQFNEPNKKISWISELETVEFKYGNAIFSGSLVHLQALIAIKNNMEIPKEIRSQLLSLKIIDQDNKIATEGNFVLPLPSFRIPNYENDDNNLEAEQQRKDRIIAKIVYIIKRAKSLPKDLFVKKLKSEIDFISDDEVEASLNNAIKREYIKIDEDDIVNYI